MSYVRIKKGKDGMHLEVYREDKKGMWKVIEVPVELFVASSIRFVSTFLREFPDDGLREWLGLAEDLARRRGILPAVEKFEIRVEWVGELRGKDSTIPVVYAIISCGREVFSGLVEPVSFAGSLLDVLRVIRGLENRCQAKLMPYEDVVMRVFSLLGEEPLEYLVPFFGNEWPSPLFVFKKNHELIFVNVKTGSVVKAGMREVEEDVIRTVKEGGY
ncbi:MAG: hypothetical protein PWP39_888 [Pyrococcus sp.]|uniref:hypothetical protein n=1 Tax=Pyrococcus sp. TaxID=33866 RepID=UPI00258EE287|nr:hypothetical protein [Pyrococcus sp.]MDK2869653.1 hypothetical protein [Pyrococcus sp.]